MPRWKLSLLGKEQLFDAAGNLIAFSTRNVLLLLAVLLEECGAPKSRRELAEVIWPDSSPEFARKSLRNALSLLRKALPDGVLWASTESIQLKGLIIECDWLELRSHADYTGSFMPSFAQDWVIDRRLQLRDRAAQDALQSATAKWAEGHREDAIRLANRASQIDPWNEDAVAFRVRCLEDVGERLQALTVADSYRTKIVRDFGVIAELSELRPNTCPPPILNAAEWLLARNPNEAISLIAATNAEWMTMPVQLSLDVHQRALEGSRRDSPERRIVFAQSMCLLVVAGRLGPQLEEAERAYEVACCSAEEELSARLAGALSYGYLSKGDFRLATQFAARSLAHAEKTDKPALKAEYRTLNAIILEHTGHSEQSWAELEANRFSVETHGALQDVAGLLMVLCDPLIRAGKFDAAAQNLQLARRMFESCHAGRSLTWVLFGEAMLHFGLGELPSARALLSQIAEMELEVGGHAVKSMADDWIATVDCQLGEYEAAAEGLARAAVFRRNLGTVPSLAERKHIRSTHRTLAERLSERDLRAALRRGASVPPPKG